ncbi:MAG: hypothetical protein DWI12_01475 [Planctomycetota bacterium]|nr:MAG: hypothetical protein DWI12_01475 [Planctomycetota bacterium]
MQFCTAHSLARRGRVAHVLPRARRGGILLELLLAIAMFAGAATFTMSALRSALDGVRRAELRARACDLAASKLAQLDAGLVSASELRGSADGGSGGAGSASSDTPLAAADDLSVEVVLLPSASVSLARARATVYDNSGAEPVVIGVYEQSIDLGERTRGSKR